MPLSPDLFRIAAEAFDPYRPGSGTEHVALLLYSLVRMARPERLVEFGSGYTTLFLLAALADNVADAAVEEEQLRIKTAAVGDRAAFDQGIEHPAVAEWYRDGGKACGVDPRYYLHASAPHLYTFEQRNDDDEYSARMTSAVEALCFTPFVTHVRGRRFGIEALPPEALPIDLAWNDDSWYEQFHEQLWPVLNPNGGLMIFHNTASVASSWDCMSRIARDHAAAGDLEVLTLQEPHKFNQNSCTILRRTTEYRPSYETRTPERVIADLERLMRQEPTRASTTGAIP